MRRKMSTNTKSANFVRAILFEELASIGCQTRQINGHIIAFFRVEDKVYAIDNRCPHMGFPLDKGSVKDGILTCHWHHARFDMESGGTFDQWADDGRAFPVEIRGGEVWVDTTHYGDPKTYHKERLQVGLERDISLVIAKAVLALMENEGNPVEPFRVGLSFGATYRRGGWGQGLTMHTCLMNMLPYLDAADRPRALYHGLTAVSRDSFQHAPRFGIRPLPNNITDIETLKRWFRRFIEVRDAEGAERCIISAIRAGADDKQMADMLFAAVTDHRYINVGHPADFTNKAFEALDIAGWEYAEPVLTSLVSGYANATRMEESNAWRNPIDLIEILDEAFEALPQALAEGKTKRGGKWNGRKTLIPILLSDDPQAITNALLNALIQGCTPTQLAQAVSYAAARRIAQFHTSNEFRDWDTALHTFTFANAIQQGLRRAPSVELMRGVFDAAMSIYLDRFLNIPAAKLPMPNGETAVAATTLNQFPTLLNQQQQVNPAGNLVADYLHKATKPNELLAMLGKLLLREDRDFHTIQCVEAAFNQYQLLHGSPEAMHVLVAAARYLAAHAPTVRAQGQTYQIAHRLHQGDHLFAEEG
ncbi:MAG: Rieske (2Fe-2S) protein [Chloroflexi bacterium]|nr:Rieske (2Fe-2S) protein [Chloroflexota bacterium]